MKSISYIWAHLSGTLYGEAFKDELADFLKQNNVGTVLECGCGDGNVLHGLAQRGLRGLGIDANEEMISMAQRNTHPNIEYRLMNWLKIDKLPETYDAVLCRGASLICVVDWGRDKSEFNPDVTKKAIEKSVRKMFAKVSKGGLLYIDTFSESNAEKGEGEIVIETGDIHLKGRIEHDWKNRMRHVYGGGTIGGEEVSGEGISYLLTPSELEGMIKDLNPRKIWRPDIKGEVQYTPVCAIR